MYITLIDLYLYLRGQVVCMRVCARACVCMCVLGGGGGMLTFINYESVQIHLTATPTTYHHHHHHHHHHHQQQQQRQQHLPLLHSTLSPRLVIWVHTHALSASVDVGFMHMGAADSQSPVRSPHFSPSTIGSNGTPPPPPPPPPPEP